MARDAGRDSPARGPGAAEAGTDPPQTLVGAVERVTYADASTLYTVLRLVPERGCDLPPATGMFHPGLVTVVGRADGLAEGLRLRLSGRWTTHRVHGPQFEFEELEVLPPGTREGLVKYLASSRFAGIGEKLAERIVDTLGENALEAVLEHPEKLKRVRGLRRAVREAFVAAVAIDLGQHRALAFLRGLGLGPWQASAVARALGPECEARVRVDPYLLASGIRGIGFATADRIATVLGFAPDDPRRARAGLVQALKDAADEGHTLLPRARLLAQARDLLGEAMPEATLAAEIGTTAREGAIDVEQGERGERAYLPHLRRSEAGLARGVASLLRAGPLPSWAPEGQADGRLADVERAARIRLHPLQREAVAGLLSTPVGLLTGGPGVGKTTIVRMVVGLAEAERARVKLASPTGRAAKRLAEATGRDASTIHRLLGFEPASGGFLHDARNPLEADLVVVDEISMLDVSLASHLVQAIRPPTRLVLVGDPDQLPSVGPGNVLRDLLDSGALPAFRLSEIYRQEKDSLIVANAHRILHGELPELPGKGDLGSDFYFFREEDPARAAEMVVDVATRRIPANFGLGWIDDVQVIAPMYRGECGVDALNGKLREALGQGGKEVVRGGRIWREGDRVIHTRNDYEKEVFNGDMGRVARVNDDASLLVRYPEREIAYSDSEFGDLQPAFAITVHRSQGGEFPAVVIPLVPQHRMMLQRNLLYTAVTRARRLVVLVGSPYALRLAVENAEQSLRESALAERLREATGLGAP